MLSSRRLPSRQRQVLPGFAAAGCWLLALAAIGAIIYSAIRGGMVDLVVYRSGAAAILHGASLYAMRTALGLRFTYPPVAAILATPLALMPLRVAMIAWIPMVYGPLAIAVWFGFRPLLDRAGAYSAAVFAAVFGFCSLLLPVRLEMSFGQIGLFLVALCLLDCALPQPKWPRGLLIGLATAIKLVPGVFIIYLLITGRRRAAGVAALSFASWTAAAFVLDPADSRTYWTSAVFDTNRLGGNALAANQSVRGMILRAFLPHQAPEALWLAAAAVVAVAGFAAARACWQRGNDMAGIAVTGLLGAALSPVAWIHHLCWAVIAIGVIVGDGRDRRRVAVAALAFGLFLTWLPVWAQVGLGSRLLPEIPGRLLEDSFGLAALALVAVLVTIRGPSGVRQARPAAMSPRADSGMWSTEQAQPRGG
jgi:alpha-1,2-mannosyltransferase